MPSAGSFEGMEKGNEGVHLKYKGNKDVAAECGWKHWIEPEPVPHYKWNPTVLTKPVHLAGAGDGGHKFTCNDEVGSSMFSRVPNHNRTLPDTHNASVSDATGNNMQRAIEQWNATS